MPKRNVCLKCAQTNFSSVCPELLRPNCASTMPQLRLVRLSSCQIIFYNLHVGTNRTLFSRRAPYRSSINACLSKYEILESPLWTCSLICCRFRYNNDHKLGRICKFFPTDAESETKRFIYIAMGVVAVVVHAVALGIIKWRSEYSLPQKHGPGKWTLDLRIPFQDKHSLHILLFLLNRDHFNIW